MLTVPVNDNNWEVIIIQTTIRNSNDTVNNKNKI